MAQVKKLSVAKVFGKIDIAALMTVVNGVATPSESPMHVMRIGGLATGTKEGVSDYGNWKALQGDFVAYSAKDGAEQRAPYAFLPDVALVPIEVALAQANTSGVRFLIDVFVKYDAESSTKYVYTFEPVVKPQGEDPVAQLLAMAAPFTVKGKDGGESRVGGMLALEAPKADAQPGPDAQKAPANKGKGK